METVRKSGGKSSVSLFTREWIEIGLHTFVQLVQKSLPLYEGVDWNANICKRVIVHWVSLFTREWIEIIFNVVLIQLFAVSLFTREWIEMPFIAGTNPAAKTSPSLRGRGLKLLSVRVLMRRTGLPLYEGVDWNKKSECRSGRYWVSLFTREWIEIISGFGVDSGSGVSLFTREWIEISWNFVDAAELQSPSLRGSGLKWDSSRTEEEQEAVSLFTREWIEIAFPSIGLYSLALSPSLRGSGLK